MEKYIGVFMKKMKIIIDTDPGVDDSAALVFALNEPKFDIKLITVGGGNIHLEKASRNMCHLLDVFKKNIPVVNGYDQRLGGTDEFAYFLHGEEGLGNYIPPKTTSHKPLNKECADAMYEVIKANPNQITILLLGPHTNFAHLLMKYPTVTRLIKGVVMMGASIDGIKIDPNHRSFNIRTDAVAFKKTVLSQIPVTLCPSKIGRDTNYFTEEQVEQIKNTNIVGKYLAKTFETYWEPNYEEKILSNCDLSALFAFMHPEYFTFKKAFIDVDTEVNIGATVGHYDRRGYFNVVQSANREKFIDLFFKKLNEFNNFETSNETFNKNLADTPEEKQTKKTTTAKTTKKVSQTKKTTKK